MIYYDSLIKMQLEWEFELKVKCLDSRSSKQHACNDKHDKLLHANETYQLKVVLYADPILTNHKFLGVCSEGRQVEGWGARLLKEERPKPKGRGRGLTNEEGREH